MCAMLFDFVCYRNLQFLMRDSDNSVVDTTIAYNATKMVAFVMVSVKCVSFLNRNSDAQIRINKII